MALTLITQPATLNRYASLTQDEKELLRELASNYLFDMATAINVPFTNIDAKDMLYKCLDFIAEGWTAENTMESRWRYFC